MPKKWRTVVGLALRGSTLLALKGLLSLLRGRKVRGWNQLNLAAAAHPAYYHRWIETSEPLIVAAWCAGGPTPPPLPRIACLVLGQDPVQREICSRALSRVLPTAIILPKCAELDQALALAERENCDWLLPIRACDRLSPYFQSALPRALSHLPPPVIFWDSDQIVDGQRRLPFIKPEWDKILLRDCDLLGGSALIRCSDAKRVLQKMTTAAADELGISRLSFVLLSTHPDQPPRHIPCLLSHHDHASPFMEESARKELLAAYDLMPPTDMDAVWPTVSIVIPTRDQAAVLQDCIASLRLDQYPAPTQLIVLDNDSREIETQQLFNRLQQETSAKVALFRGEFNFAAMMNFGAAQAHGEYLCFLNNDVEALNGDWLKHLVMEAMAPDVGAVGARLLYPDGAVQHVGVAIGIGGAAGHVQKGVSPDDPWLANWHQTKRRVSAVTGACMVIQRSKFVAAGGMNAQDFAVDFNDVDLCLKLQGLGFMNVVAPQATLVHHESKTRGTARTSIQRDRFARELAMLRERWGTSNHSDPWHSPLFRPENERCLLVF